MYFMRLQLGTEKQFKFNDLDSDLSRINGERMVMETISERFRMEVKKVRRESHGPYVFPVQCCTRIMSPCSHEHLLSYVQVKQRRLAVSWCADDRQSIVVTLWVLEVVELQQKMYHDVRRSVH